MDSTTDLIERKLVEHEGKVRFRLEGMAARDGFLYQALEDYLQLPELAEKRVTVFPTEDGGEYIVNYSRSKQTLGESHFTEAIEIHCSSWRMPDRKRQMPEKERVFIALRVDDGKKSGQRCIRLSLFDLTPSVIEHFAWLVGYLCERFPDAKLIDDIKDDQLREWKKLEIWRPKEVETTYAPDLRSVVLPPADKTQTTTPGTEAELPAQAIKPDTSTSEEQEPVKNSPPMLIGEYIFSGTPEHFVTVANKQAPVCEPFDVYCVEHQEPIPGRYGRQDFPFPPTKRDPHHTEIRLHCGRWKQMYCEIHALIRPGNQATVNVELHTNFTMDDWIRQEAGKAIEINRDALEERFTRAWDALRAAIIKHGYTFTPLDASREVVTTATIPETQQNDRSSRIELRTVYAYCRWLLGYSDKEIVEDWIRLYALEKKREAADDQVDAIEAIEAARKRMKKKYEIDRPKDAA